jgi:ADP-ribose pyrophosphatase YjhB (NUDIX family)
LALQVQVHAAIWVDGKLVVHRSMRHGRDRVTLPGGRVKVRESIPDALRREVREEVDLDVEIGALRFAGEVLNLSLQDVLLIFDATIVGNVQPGDLDLVDPRSPEAERILPPVVTALASEPGNGAPPWLGNLAIADQVASE